MGATAADQEPANLAACPSNAVCSTAMSLAMPVPDDMDISDFADALFNVSTSGILEVSWCWLGCR